MFPLRKDFKRIIKRLLRKKFKANGPIVLLVYIFLPLFLGCTSFHKTTGSIKHHGVALSDEERTVLLQFFRTILFDNSGAYTLYGEKPVSITFIEQPLTKQERDAWETYYNGLSDRDKADLELLTPRYDLIANYKGWQLIQPKIPISQYLFGSFELDEKTEIFVFVNIEMTLRTLLEYYEDFRRSLGYDFDPYSTVFDVRNSESPFWKHIMTKGHALLGILLGYGRDNAWFFEWKTLRESSEFLTSLPSKMYAKKLIKYPTPEEFSIPYFNSYGLYPTDKGLLKEYERTKKTIKTLYKNRDEVDVALDWLCR